MRLHCAGADRAHVTRGFRANTPGVVCRRHTQSGRTAPFHSTYNGLRFMESILVINAGSSSLKFQIFALEANALTRKIRGQMDGIGVRPRFRASSGEGVALLDRNYRPEAVPDLPHAIKETREWLRSLDGFEFLAIGHRVVHGGPHYASPVLIDADVLNRLAELQELAPLHQPNNLAPIRLAMEINPNLPQVACFDTAFHRGQPEHAVCYAIPQKLLTEGIRRYGFHGLSYSYIADRLRHVAPDMADRRVIVAHLGSGASMCALLEGSSLECTTGFTALDGVPMGTRPGQLDPGVILHLVSQRGMRIEDVSDMLYRESGLKGLSGVSSDMRELLAREEPNAVLAIRHFVHRCALCAGQLAAALGGLDAFVFTAGIGENSARVRALIAERLSWLGAELDSDANERGDICISTPDSRVALFVIPTDEEYMIARETKALLKTES